MNKIDILALILQVRRLIPLHIPGSMNLCEAAGDVLKGEATTCEELTFFLPDPRQQPLVPEFRHILRSSPLVKLVDTPKEYRISQWISRGLHIGVLSADATIWERNFTKAELLHAYLQSYDLGSRIASDPAVIKNLESFFDRLKQVSIFFKRGYLAPNEPRATAMASYRSFANLINTTETFVWGVKHYFYNKGVRCNACLNLSDLWLYSREKFGMLFNYKEVLESRRGRLITDSASLINCLFAIVHGVNADYVFERLMYHLAMRNKQDEPMYEAMLKHFIKEPPTLPGKRWRDAMQLNNPPVLLGQVLTNATPMMEVTGGVAGLTSPTFKVSRQHNCTLDKQHFGPGDTVTVTVGSLGAFSFTLQTELPFKGED